MSERRHEIVDYLIKIFRGIDAAASLKLAFLSIQYVAVEMRSSAASMPRPH